MKCKFISNQAQTHRPNYFKFSIQIMWNFTIKPGGEPLEMLQGGQASSAGTAGGPQREKSQRLGRVGVVTAGHPAQEVQRVPQRTKDTGREQGRQGHCSWSRKVLKMILGPQG